MKFTTTKTLLALSLSALVSTSIAAPYEIIDLGGLDGNTSVARDINEAGVAVGYANGPINENGQRSFDARATQFDQAGNIDLGVLVDGTISEAVGINDAMVAVGSANELSEEEQSSGNTVTVSNDYAVIFEGGTVTKLPPLEGLIGTTAYAINNNDQIILSGLYDVDPEDENNPVERGFVFDRSSSTYSMVEPFADGANKTSALTDINDNGQVVGFSAATVDGSNTFKSFIASVDGLSQLNEIPSIDNRAIFASGLNANGEVVGNIFISGTRNQFEAFYFDAAAGDTEITLLGFLDPDFNHSQANDINNNGQIVGKTLISVPTLGEFGAFIHEDGEMKDLKKLVGCNSGWKLTEAVAINDSGQIVGFGAKDGEVRAFRLDPTGEPVEDCDADSPSNDGGGSFPTLLVAVLAVLGIRRKYAS